MAGTSLESLFGHNPGGPVTACTLGPHDPPCLWDKMARHCGGLRHPGFLVIPAHNLSAHLVALGTEVPAPKPRKCSKLRTNNIPQHNSSAHNSWLPLKMRPATVLWLFLVPCLYKQWRLRLSSTVHYNAWLSQWLAHLSDEKLSGSSHEWQLTHTSCCHITFFQNKSELSVYSHQ